VSDTRGTAGWFPDPTGRCEYRYWNGERWTADVSVHGSRFVDPIGPATYQPGWGPAAPATARRTRGLAVAAFVVGLVSLAVAWIPFIVVVGAAGAITAFVFGVIGLRRAHSNAGYGRGYAITGIVLSVAALAMCVLGVVLTARTIDEFNRYLDPGPYTAAITECSAGAGLVSAKGTITNLDSVPHGYTLTITYSLAGKDIASELKSVPSVPAGGVGQFSSTMIVASSGKVACAVTDVAGPPPFGLPGS